MEPRRVDGGHRLVAVHEAEPAEETDVEGRLGAHDGWTFPLCGPGHPRDARGHAAVGAVRSQRSLGGTTGSMTAMALCLRYTWRRALRDAYARWWMLPCVARVTSPLR